jgi:hypothetical protein
MQVSFRKLPLSHRWMLFALLEVDQSQSLSKGSSELEDRYNALCPSEVHQPFKRVIGELTEAFIKKSPGVMAERIDWIHPSCRDLAIDELCENPKERQHFLANCSLTGLALASSFAGGAEGRRHLPLLQSKSDWQQFANRAEQLATQDRRVLFRIWQNYLVLKKQMEGEQSLARSLTKLLEVIKPLLHLLEQEIQKNGYSEAATLRMYFEICRALKLSPSVDLTNLWLDCRKHVRDWVDHPDDPWEDAIVPQNVSKFINVLNRFAPSFLRQPEIKKQLNETLELILERAEADTSCIFDSTRDEEEISRRATGFDDLNESFEELADIPIWSPRQGESLKEYASNFHAQAESLREDITQEPDYDDDGHSSSSSSNDEVDIAELFQDL